MIPPPPPHHPAPVKKRSLPVAIAGSLALIALVALAVWMIMARM